MEEQVGALWHRLVTRMADRSHIDCTVELGAVERMLGTVFRAFGGDGGLQIQAASATASNARRGFMQRLAGSNQTVELAWRDARGLCLPEKIGCFPALELNRDLYVWLAALAAAATETNRDWLLDNQRLTLTTLQRWPGLSGRYRRLVDAHLAQRPAADSLGSAEAARERAIRGALSVPGSIDRWPAGRRDPQPVPLWLHPAPPSLQAVGASDESVENNNERRGKSRDPANKRRRRGERVKTPRQNRGLITIRMENILSWGEFVNVDRATEDEEDLSRAEALLDDLERLSISRNRNAAAGSLRFDLDLPAASADDLVLGEGIRLPEWDWRRGCMIPDHCRIQPMLARRVPATALPDHLQMTARRLRRQFQALEPALQWCHAQPEGPEIDIDAYVRASGERKAGMAVHSDGLYQSLQRGSRDLACLLLADLSLSTDAFVDDRHRVVDVIRDSLLLFGEALSCTGDRFSMYGFSSRKRDPVRLHILKAFDERYGGDVRGRIQAIKPGYYTRMGAAVRYAARKLALESSGRRLLLLLSDGKPNDLDHYEGRYGVEDTRRAVQDARAQGITPFCVTIDPKGNDYLPYLFGAKGYVVIRKPTDLPRRLPMLYARLTA